MEPPKGDQPKLPDMVMCGDHPSITKTELNIKEDRIDEKISEKDKKERPPVGYARISPSSSRTERLERALTEQKSRVMSEHAMRLFEARRHAARSADVISRHEDINAPANRALVQAALGSFRWPPYLVAVWVVVLVLTHVLHCVVTMLERALPSLKKLCAYFRAWAESAWRGEAEAAHRLVPLALAALTALLYAAYVGLYALYAAALWAVEPLCGDEREREDETKVTDYTDDDFNTANTNTNTNTKQIFAHKDK